MVNIVVATGEIKENYKVLDSIFAFDSHTEGFFTSANPNKAFEGVKQQLRQICQSIGGDAVINCQFEYRMALADGFMGKKQAIEIFAYGTAVQIIQSPIIKSPVEKADDVIEYLKVDTQRMEDLWQNLIDSGEIEPQSEVDKIEQLRTHLYKYFHDKEISKKDLNIWKQQIDQYFKE